MRPAFTSRPLTPLSHWQQLPNGDWLQQQVAASLDEWWPKLFGYHLLKLGSLAAELPSSASPITHQISLDPQAGGVRAQLDALPFRQASIDVCVASFTLEFRQDPHRLLREIDRVIISGGHLLLLGFDGFSPLLLGQLLPQQRQRPPWNGRLFSSMRVEDWLGVLGYSVISKQWLTQHSFLGSPERFGAIRHCFEQWLPNFGSVYLIVARKMDSPLTPIRQKWRLPRPLVLNPIADLAGYQEGKVQRKDKSG
ncbi:methyltransferase domain-containing protein [Ferrimonas senticii]|uniref:methyltransferase domain-containing protein n=1 Tax=Ferrimonas senticii TaxID=394566 RepID=UPI00040E7886|nr:methyltransferase domain-containing protein [Ferrimonas senticii]